MTRPKTSEPSVSAGADRLVEALVKDSRALRCEVAKGPAGERRIDLGAKVAGGLEAGRRLAEICLAGLGTVAITTSSGIDRWPWAVSTHTSMPVIACLASQYGGWTLSDEASNFFALGSGPARALAGKEDLFNHIGYVDHYDRAVIIIEASMPPPPQLVERIASDCKVAPASLTILYAPTGSLAGTVQIAARSLEVALHKAYTLVFPLERIVDGTGTAPLAPPTPDLVKAMGRTNDAIIYGGRVQLFVRGPDDDARRLAQTLPSKGSKAYGRPFADIFSEAHGDFYKIDPMLFSPATVSICNLDTGSTFRAGELAPDIVDASFS
jgi:methenyltetrahydromethanopterin cyclohydrolase